MIHHDHHKKQQSQMWFCFTLGSIIGASGLFLIGTAQGRKLLRKAMEMAENMETSASKMIADLEDEAEEKGQKIKDFAEPLIGHTPLHTVLQKIQTVLPQHKVIEKSFVKHHKSLK